MLSHLIFSPFSLSPTHSYCPVSLSLVHVHWLLSNFLFILIFWYSSSFSHGDADTIKCIPNIYLSCCYALSIRIDWTCVLDEKFDLYNSNLSQCNESFCQICKNCEWVMILLELPSDKTFSYWKFWSKSENSLYATDIHMKYKIEWVSSKKWAISIEWIDSYFQRLTQNWIQLISNEVAKMKLSEVTKLQLLKIYWAQTSRWKW